MADRRRAPLWLLIVLAGIAVLGVVFYQSNPLNREAQRYATTVSVASAGVYVTLRTLNAVLSTAQEVEVSGSAVVVSGSAQPLKVLEPVDDTIERIAGMVFLMLVATGVLAVAIGPIGAVGSGMIAVALTLWILDRMLGQKDVIVVLARRLAWYGAFLAIAIPLAFMVSSVVADHLTQDVWSDNSAIIDDITKSVTLDGVGVADGAETPSGFWGALEKADDYRVLALSIFDRADELIGSYVAILAVFLFKVFLLPALLMGGFFVLFRFFAHQPEPEGAPHL